MLITEFNNHYQTFDLINKIDIPLKCLFSELFHGIKHIYVR